MTYVFYIDVLSIRCNKPDDNMYMTYTLYTIPSPWKKMWVYIKTKDANIQL